MEKVKKFISDNQDAVTAAVQLLFCITFLFTSASGFVKKATKGKGKKK